MINTEPNNGISMSMDWPKRLRAQAEEALASLSEERAALMARLRELDSAIFDAKRLLGHSKSSSRAMRVGYGAKAQALKQVMSSGEWMRRGEMRRATGMTNSAVQSQLAQLFYQGLVELRGERGSLEFRLVRP